MSAESLDQLLRRFRRSVQWARVLRWALICFFAAAFVGAFALEEKQGRQSLALLAIAGLFLWASVLTRSVRITREIQAGNRLLALGMLDEAEACLARAAGKFSLSARVRFMLFQQLAVLFFQRDAHPQVIAVCREMLRHPIQRLQSIWFNTRLLLADSLLLTNQVSEAYEAMRPVYNVPLSLADRIKLLPIQLRYELTSDHAASAVEGMAEKVKIAELLESQRAGLVHALLAEACRRMGMDRQHAYLAERARLYCDLKKIAGRYPIIAPIVPNEPAAGDPAVS